MREMNHVLITEIDNIIDRVLSCCIAKGVEKSEREVTTGINCQFYGSIDNVALARRRLGSSNRTCVIGVTDAELVIFPSISPISIRASVDLSLTVSCVRLQIFGLDLDGEINVRGGVRSAFIRTLLELLIIGNFVFYTDRSLAGLNVLFCFMAVQRNMTGHRDVALIIIRIGCGTSP